MMLVPEHTAGEPTAFTVPKMSYDSNKSLPIGKIAPVTSKRTKAGPYVAPRLAAGSISTTSPELSKETRNAPRSSKVSKEDTSTPVKTFLSSNITPRSGQRSARIHSPASTPGGTPTGTPSSSRPTSMLVSKDHTSDETAGGALLGMVSGSSKFYSGSGNTMNMGKAIMNPHRGISPDRLNQTSQAPSPERAPMFFHANEAKQPPIRSPAPRSVVNSPNESSQAKFYHANGMPEVEGRTRQNSSSMASNSRPSLRLAGSSQPPRRAQTRSQSPLKGDTQGMTSISKRSPRSSAEAKLKAPKSRSPSNSISHASSVRRASSRSQDSIINTHNKTLSTSSTDSTVRRSSITTDGETTPSPAIISPSLTTEPAALLPPIDTSQSTLVSPASPLTSPTRMMAPKTDSKIEELNKLAANARRERKVLDLEISNSSLLAINRTLEREIRKQTTELRRYRRLTSTGRISLPRRSASSRVSGATTDDGLSFGTPDLSDSEDTASLLSDLDELEDEDYESSQHSDESLSSEAQAIRDARQRERDEKRLQLDLSKHQQILIESQKMNQSLKRCLGWTEELIKEGKKALAYQVHVSDVEVGGRILREDEIDMELDSRKALLSPSLDGEGVKGMHWGQNTETFSTLAALTSDAEIDRTDLLDRPRHTDEKD